MPFKLYDVKLFRLLIEKCRLGDESSCELLDRLLSLLEQEYIVCKRMLIPVTLSVMCAALFTYVFILPPCICIVLILIPTMLLAYTLYRLAMLTMVLRRIYELWLGLCSIS